MADRVTETAKEFSQNSSPSLTDRVWDATKTQSGGEIHFFPLRANELMDGSWAGMSVKDPIWSRRACRWELSRARSPGEGGVMEERHKSCQDTSTEKTLEKQTDWIHWSEPRPEPRCCFHTCLSNNKAEINNWARTWSLPAGSHEASKSSRWDVENEPFFTSLPLNYCLPRFPAHTSYTFHRLCLCWLN